MARIDDMATPFIGCIVATPKNNSRAMYLSNLGTQIARLSARDC
jgi:hypothetical protein